jgi:NAD(P)-dependent dehydrogenase (short-subunit alcohol dehydrogenase family)
MGEGSLKESVVGLLRGKIAVITGASRGIGKGIALALAEEGATVYVTGRTVEPGSAPLPGSIGETVNQCNERGAKRGGKGIGVVLDLMSDTSIAALFNQVKREQGRLDILVNNAMAVSDAIAQRIGFWEKPLSELEVLDTGVRAAYIAAWYAANIMVPQRCGLIAAISGAVGVSYANDVLFGTTKCAVDRMARDMAIELKPHNVASLSLWQGSTFTERVKAMIDAYPVLAERLKAGGSSPEFPGRVIAVLANDPRILDKTGGTFVMAELAAEYGVTDIGGAVIPAMTDGRSAPIWQPV